MYRAYECLYSSTDAHSLTAQYEARLATKIKSSESISVTQLSLLLKPRATCSLIIIQRHVQCTLACAHADHTDIRLSV